MSRDSAAGRGLREEHQFPNDQRTPLTLVQTPSMLSTSPSPHRAAAIALVLASIASLAGCVAPANRRRGHCPRNPTFRFRSSSRPRRLRCRDVGPNRRSDAPTVSARDSSMSPRIRTSQAAAVGGPCRGSWPVTRRSRPRAPGSRSRTPRARRDGGGGDDGNTPRGEGCNVSDLCAAGWHVCTTAGEIALHSRNGCNGATRDGDPPLFFASRQSSTGCACCGGGREDGRGLRFPIVCGELSPDRIDLE